MKKQETTEKNLENAQKDDESFYCLLYTSGRKLGVCKFAVFLVQ